MSLLKKLKTPQNIIVIVAALGYFVDIYDLILFSIIRKKSLMGIGIAEADCLSIGEHLISMQMMGMLIGGVLWGILGDKKGRLSVLFGSILLYSIANIANGMVDNVESYSWWRLIAGIGLAGELGAGITLVSETMSKEKRGWGTMAVVSFGVLGGVFAGLIGQSFDWRTCYYLGGVMGLVLLLLRIGVFESGMYTATKNNGISRGNFLQLFNNKKRFIKYLQCITIGLPIWFLIGILITFSPEFSKAKGVSNISAATAVMVFYAGTSFGDFMSGYLSQVFKTRKKIVFFFLILTSIGIPLYLFTNGISQFAFYAICVFLGLAGGYWAIFVTIASEQFGTNLRSTVTTTVPNFVRGGLVFLLLLFNFFKNNLPDTGIALFSNSNNVIIYSALFVGIISVIIAFLSLWGMEETFGKDLNYVEK